ncbi:hypothetical protein GCM10022204_02860 [Microlunatus aurantiacus]|uniref:Uncharacterized protein n=1 Tax=Microlunatus aurantiacus TaxID=446786 RepID=A0ABP7CM38_9ACTN
MVEMSPQPVGRDFPAGRVVVYDPAPTLVTAASAGRVTTPATSVPAARLRATNEAANRERRRRGWEGPGPAGAGVARGWGEVEDPCSGSLEKGGGSVAMGESPRGMKTG